MFLSQLSLQNFRNYKKSSFEFTQGVTLIIGPNASGKTNILEAISLLSLGKSLRGAKTFEMVRFGEGVATLRGVSGDQTLEAILTSGDMFAIHRQAKKLLVNGVGKRQIDFVGNLKASIFEPEDLELVHATPKMRRDFLDDVLIQVDRDYRRGLAVYDRALRQRNSILRKIKEGVRGGNFDLEYWDSLLIDNGGILTDRRARLIEFLNQQDFGFGSFSITYDKSTITKERLGKYYQAEREAGATLVGPQRDDILLFQDKKSLASFASRGQQRMAVLWLKLGELAFLEKESQDGPMLLLDDIFSELDDEHIAQVVKVIDSQQTIITTAHKELIDKNLLKKASVIELK